ALVEEALKKTGSDRHALRARLVARLAMVSPKQLKKQIDLLAENDNPPPRPRASVFRVAALLPGSGAYESYGRAVRLGLQFALAEARGGQEPPIELRYLATGEGDPRRGAGGGHPAARTGGGGGGRLPRVPAACGGGGGPASP